LRVTGANKSEKAPLTAAKILHADPCGTWLGHRLGQMLLTGRPFEKILFFSKILVHRQQALTAGRRSRARGLVTAAAVSRPCSSRVRTADADIRGPKSAAFLADAESMPKAEIKAAG